MHAHAINQFAAWPRALDEPVSNGRRHVSDSSMSVEDMTFHQKRAAECDVRELILRCRDRYCFAHELLKPHAILPERLFDRAMLNLDDFYLPWADFCSAYRKFMFSPQMCLFENQRERELTRWRGFVEKECFERFVKAPDWVRAVLETANLIQERGPNREIFVGHLFDDIILDVKERSECAHEQYE